MQLLVLVYQNRPDKKYLIQMSVSKLLRQRQMLIDSFKSRIFPIKNLNIDDGYHVFDNEFDPLRTPAAAAVVLNAPPPPRSST